MRISGASPPVLGAPARERYRALVSDDRLRSAVGLRLTSVALFAAMNTLIKLAEAGGARLGEILFFRQAGAAVLVASVVACGPGLASLRSRRMGAHVLRAVVGLTTMAFAFGSILRLQLAEATTLGFSMPIFATVLGALVLGEPTGWRRWAAVLAGFVGVLIVTRPGGGTMPLDGIGMGLAAAFGTACVSILLRQIGRTERPMTTVFWFSALSLLPLSGVYLFSRQAHAAPVWATLAAIGLFGGAAQLAMTASLQRAPVSVVVPIDYTALLWATAFGWVVFGTLPAPEVWAGAPLLVGSGLFIVWREHGRRRAATRQLVVQE